MVEEHNDPERGDVLILGNETSALLVGLLHDTRTPRQMALDLVQTQKEATPDLAVVQSEETSAGSVLMFLQYTIHPQSASAMLIDEKALLGTLEPGALDDHAARDGAGSARTSRASSSRSRVSSGRSRRTAERQESAGSGA